MKRVLLDTNVWISAFLNPYGPPGKIVTSGILDKHFEICLSGHLRLEMLTNVLREDIQRALRKKNLLIRTEVILGRIRDEVPMVRDISPQENWLPSDPSDNWVIQCALTAGADCIVTGDRALLALGTAEGIR